MEIERKWILKRVPTEFHLVKNSKVEQLYISINPEVRLRYNSGSKEPFRITVKGEGTLSREEIETEISEDFYNQIKNFVGKSPITKDYSIFNCGGYPLAVSVVDNGAFIYAEVEFESEEQARNFQLPIDDAVEVTDDPNYKMKIIGCEVAENNFKARTAIKNQLEIDIK